MGEDIEKVPSIGISYTVELPGKKALVLQSFVDRDTGDLNGVLDKIRIAAERQHARGMIELAARQLEVEEKMLADHVTRMSQVEENHNRRWRESNRKGEMRLTDAEQKALQQTHALVEESKRRIEACKKDLTEFRQIAGIGA